MQVRKTEFHRFANGESVFVIPVYQRNYDWTKDNCKQLFYDILNDMQLRIVEKQDIEGHFIGTICLKSNSRYTSVIVDGQQRLTSLMILLKAIYNSTEDQRLKRKIKTQFLVNEFANDELKIKLKPIKRDESAYNKLITSDVFNIKDFDTSEINGNVMKNYLYFKSLIEQELSESQLYYFLEALEQLEIVELILEKENPQVIFESLNSTGLDLTNTDLLRNYLLMSLDYNVQEKMYTNYWAKIEEMIGSENMETFMLHYLLLKNKTHNMRINGKPCPLSPSTLYVAFKRRFPNIQQTTEETIEKLFKDLLHYADCYQNLLFNNNFQIKTDVDKCLYELFYCLEQPHAAILVLYLTDHLKENIITQDVYVQVLKIMIVLAARGTVCGKTCYSKQSALLLQKLDDELLTNSKLKLELQQNKYDEYVNLWYRVLTSGKGSYSFPKDIEFQTALQSNDLYRTLKSRRCKYLLYKIEQYYNPNECLSFDSGTIEHVMPQTLSDAWKQDLNEQRDLMNYETYVDTIGNLTLTGYNPLLSNNVFSDKQVHYKTSNYSITRKIADETKWSSKEIAQRAKELADVATIIWPLPAEYNKAFSIDTGITYNLNSDFNSFIGTKPDTISIFGTKQQVTNWSDFVTEVCKSLYELDDEMFIRLLKTKKFPGKKPWLGEGAPPHNRVGIIDEVKQYYVFTNNHTEDNLLFIKNLFDYYDEELKMNLIDDVWFTIRIAG